LKSKPKSPNQEQNLEQPSNCLYNLIPASEKADAQTRDAENAENINKFAKTSKIWNDDDEQQQRYRDRAGAAH
jgi:hypothetical protein